MQHLNLDTPVSPLRQRLIDDMNLRRFSRETQRNYRRRQTPFYVGGMAGSDHCTKREAVGGR